MISMDVNAIPFIFQMVVYTCTCIYGWYFMGKQKILITFKYEDNTVSNIVPRELMM